MKGASRWWPRLMKAASISIGQPKIGWAAECGSHETLPSHGRPSWVLLRISRVTVSTSMAFPTSTTQIGTEQRLPQSRLQSEVELIDGLEEWKVSLTGAALQAGLCVGGQYF